MAAQNSVVESPSLISYLLSPIPIEDIRDYATPQ